MDNDLLTKQSEQNERALTAIGVTVPQAESKSQTLSSGSSTNFSNKLKRYTGSARTSDSRTYTFPSNLATDSTNMHWTKLTIYELSYTGSSNKIYRGDGSSQTVALRENMAKTKNSNSLGDKVSDKKFTSNYKMTDQTIALPYPKEAPDGSFSVNWNDGTEWGAFANAFATLMDGSKGAFDKIGTIGKDVISRLQTKIPKQVTAGVEKRIRNERTEMLFSGVGTRKPNMSWELYPKNSDEASTAIAIIEVLKNLSLPELMTETAGGEGDVHWLMFPAMFEICFMYGEEENIALPRFGPCAITNLKASPIMGDGWRAHNDGSPIGWDLEISFSEVFPLTRENLKQENGYMHVR